MTPLMRVLLHKEEHREHVWEQLLWLLHQYRTVQDASRVTKVRCGAGPGTAVGSVQVARGLRDLWHAGRSQGAPLRETCNREVRGDARLPRLFRQGKSKRVGARREPRGSGAHLWEMGGFAPTSLGAVCTGSCVAVTVAPFASGLTWLRPFLPLLFSCRASFLSWRPWSKFRSPSPRASVLPSAVSCTAR